jgi:MFS family permease
MARSARFRRDSSLHRLRLRLEHLQPGADSRVRCRDPAGEDWLLSDVVWIFTVAIVFLGLAAALAGKWLEDVGPRMVGAVAAACWGGGYLVGGLGIYLHALWLVYLGYWRHRRLRLRSRLRVAGQHFDSLVPGPPRHGDRNGDHGLRRRRDHRCSAQAVLIRTFYEAPDYLGPVSDVSLVTEGGRRFAQVAGELREVVIVGANDVGGMIVRGAEGVYAVGTGNVGVAETFITLGLIYFVVMLAAAFSYRLPAPGWRPAGWTPPDDAHRAKRMISANNVDIDEALKTRQFYQLWIVLCFNVTAGIGVLSVAQTMMTEIFGTTLPSIVDSGFAATYVVMISLFNMAGRFIWASSSDYIGRRNTYWVFFALGIALYLSIPWVAEQVSVQPAAIWLVYFYAATMIIFTMYGGGFATIPAYLADMFGTRYVGGIHGRLLTAWSVAGVFGPLAITSLRERSIDTAIHDLAARVDPERFRAAFGAGLDQLDALQAQQTVTIAKLMEIAPPGTINPTPSLYNLTMYLMAALLAIALVANALMRPVDAKHHMAETRPAGAR